jgi:hypothetical protein
MKMPAGPLAFESRHAPLPLNEDEEAALAFAACGITGHALADLCYAPGGGGTIMGGLLARTVASGFMSVFIGLKHWEFHNGRISSGR